MSLSENIKRLRLQKQLSLPELAEESGLSRGYVYMLESGETTNPSLEKLSDISQALDCTIADLIGEAKATIRNDKQYEIPSGLQDFAKHKKRIGEPLDESELRTLASVEYRGKRPTTAEDWAYVHEFLKRTLGKE